MKEEKTIWDLELHETICIDDLTEAMKVPGGWIYYTYYPGNPDHIKTTVFVPWQPKQETK